jgi:hypothetical protein
MSAHAGRTAVTSITKKENAARKRRFRCDVAVGSVTNAAAARHPDDDLERTASGRESGVAAVVNIDRVPSRGKRRRRHRRGAGDERTSAECRSIDISDHLPGRNPSSRRGGMNGRGDDRDLAGADAAENNKNAAFRRRFQSSAIGLTTSFHPRRRRPFSGRRTLRGRRCRC